MNQLNTVVSPLTIPTWKRVIELADLVEIFDPSVQLCSWQRTIDPLITTYLESLEQSGKLQLIETLPAEEPVFFDRLPAGPGREALIEDLSLLRDILCELMDCPAVGLRLARIGYAMCPGWHIDRTGIRLVCTYKGPGTEWLNNQQIDRNHLGSEKLKDQNFIQAETGEMVLLKGTLWQENEQFGSVHRSPEIEADSGLRTVVTLDPLWID